MFSDMQRAAAAASTGDIGSTTGHPQGHESLSTNMTVDDIGEKVKSSVRFVTWTLTLVTESYGTEVIRVDLRDEIFGKKKKEIRFNGTPVEPRTFKDPLGYAFMFETSRFNYEVHIPKKPKDKSAASCYTLYVNKIAFSDLTYASLMGTVAGKGGGGAGAAESKQGALGGDQVQVTVPNYGLPNAKAGMAPKEPGTGKSLYEPLLGI